MIGVSIAAKKEWKIVLDYYQKEINDLDKYPYGEYFINNINDKKVLFYRCGTRKTKASGATQYMISKFNLKKIILIGTAAGVDSKNNLLDIFIPKKAVQTDCTFIEDGECLKDDYIVDIDLSDHKFIYNTCTIASQDKPLIHKKTCDLMHSHAFTLVDMESAPVAFICQVNKVDFVIIKGISDFPGNYLSTDKRQYDEYRNNIPKVMLKIINEYLYKFL